MGDSLKAKSRENLVAGGWSIAIRSYWKKDGAWYLLDYLISQTRREAIRKFDEGTPGLYTKLRRQGVAKAVRVHITAEVPE